MAERKKLPAPATVPAKIPARRPLPKPPVEVWDRWVTSGSVVLDLALGQGWKCGRFANLVGDKSAGKTLLATEAVANMAALFGTENCRYAEAEYAFDEDYGQLIGMPKGMEPIHGIDTIQKFYTDLDEWMDKLPTIDNVGRIYVLDSFDALSDADELERDFEDGATYAMQKAKKTSEMFRRLIGKVAEKNVLLLIISQVRENIGVTFGEKYKRGGGKALDFYASQILWLADTGKIKRTVRGVERIVGANVKANVKKNKVAMAYRQVDLTVMFQYGVDDELTMLNWLKAQKGERHIWTKPDDIVTEIRKLREAHDRPGLRAIAERLANGVFEHWEAIEEGLRPPMRKYGGDE